MKYAADLHIHTALSPCSEKDMTPNNIVNMALLKQLDIIAITDHNTAENINAVCKCSEGRNIIVVPGMEIETAEEVHLIGLFPDIEKALYVQERIYESLPDIANRADIFGDQLVMDEEDNIKGSLKQMLLTAASLSTSEIFNLVFDVGGVVIPAHIDRNSYSMLSNLGIIPEELKISCLEISKMCNPAELVQQNSRLEKYRLIKSSDAHSLGDILERETFFNLTELSIECLLAELKQPVIYHD